MTDYRTAFISKNVNGEMLLKLTAKELEEFLEIKALADVKALENNINALRTAGTFSVIATHNGIPVEYFKYFFTNYEIVVNAFLATESALNYLFYTT